MIMHTAIPNSDEAGDRSGSKYRGETSHLIRDLALMKSPALRAFSHFKSKLSG